MTKGSISIVVPTLNEAKLLPDCLRSLAVQDYGGQYEVIIADNGSTDSTVGIARSFGIKVVSCSQRQSVFYARQVGASAASGDIIVQADADTVYPRDWLRKLADQFAAHPGAVAVAGRFIYRDPTPWAKVEYFFRNAINKLTTALSGTPLLVSGATFAFRREAFLKVGGYEGLDYSADQYGIATRLSKVGRVLYDRHIFVLTSSRSVQKPIYVLAGDVLVHLNRLCLYLARANTVGMKPRVARARPRRIATGFFSGGMVIILLFAYGYFIPASPVFGKVYYKGGTAEKVVALTFDDGPNGSYTQQVLDILGSHSIKATFFAIGKNVELYPEVARRIVAEGNVIANHSYSHDANHALSLSGAKDVQQAQLAISLTLGVVPHLYRPPHGKKSPWELMRIRKEGLIEVTWSASANDQPVLGYFGNVSPGAFAKRIVRGTSPGAIVLLHDGYGTAHDTAKSDRSLTVQALPLIIEQLQAKGYRFVTVPELLGVPAYNN